MCDNVENNHKSFASIPKQSQRKLLRIPTNDLVIPERLPQHAKTILKILAWIPKQFRSIFSNNSNTIFQQLLIITQTILETIPHTFPKNWLEMFGTEDELKDLLRLRFRPQHRPQIDPKSTPNWPQMAPKSLPDRSKGQPSRPEWTPVDFGSILGPPLGTLWDHLGIKRTSFSSTCFCYHF